MRGANGKLLIYETQVLEASSTAPLTMLKQVEAGTRTNFFLSSEFQFADANDLLEVVLNAFD